MIPRNGKCMVMICFLLKRIKFGFRYGGHVVLLIGEFDITPMRPIFYKLIYYIVMALHTWVCYCYSGVQNRLKFAFQGRPTMIKVGDYDTPLPDVDPVGPLLLLCA